MAETTHIVFRLTYSSSSCDVEVVSNQETITALIDRTRLLLAVQSGQPIPTTLLPTDTRGHIRLLHTVGMPSAHVNRATDRQG